MIYKLFSVIICCYSFTLLSMDQDNDIQKFDYDLFLTTIPKETVDTHLRKFFSFKDIAILKQVCKTHNDYWSTEKICLAASKHENNCSTVACLHFASNNSRIRTLQHFALTDPDMFFHLFKKNIDIQTIKKAFGIRSYYLLSNQDIIDVYQGRFIPIQYVCQNQINQLHKAIRKRKIPAAILLLQTILIIPTIFRTTKTSSRTLVKAICQLGDLPLFNILINKNIDYLNHCAPSGTSVLQTVATHGSIEMLKELLKFSPEKLNINFKDNAKQTALHYTAARGKIEQVRLLCTSGADLNTTDLMGNTPLHAAVQNGWDKIVSVLLSFNGDAVGIPNIDQSTPLHLAASRSARKSAKLLLENEAEIDRKNMRGDTALHVACLQGNVNFAKFLLQNGASVNPLNIAGHTPLDIVLLFNRSNKKAALLKLLYAAGGTIGPLLPELS